MRVAWSRCLVTPDRPPVEAAPMEVRLDDVAELPRRMMLTTQDVTRSLIGARAGELLMFHAGAVSHPRTGRSVVYVAAGGTGKTTLSLLLGRRLGYLTDETVGIDSSGVIHPYPKPLSVRRTGEAGLKQELSPDDLGLVGAPPAPRLGRVVLLHRQESTSRATLVGLDFMDALFRLAEQSSSLASLPRPLHVLADVIDGAGPVLELRYGDASQVADDLFELVDGPG